jgi:hypothetical protein
LSPPGHQMFVTSGTAYFSRRLFRDVLLQRFGAAEPPPATEHIPVPLDVDDGWRPEWQYAAILQPFCPAHGSTVPSRELA